MKKRIEIIFCVISVIVSIFGLKWALNAPINSKADETMTGVMMFIFVTLIFASVIDVLVCWSRHGDYK